MNTLPFNTTTDTDITTVYQTARDLQTALNEFNGAGTEQLSDTAMESLFDYLNQYADYTDGVWEGTDVPLNIDTIDSDSFADLLIRADNGDLD